MGWFAWASLLAALALTLVVVRDEVTLDVRSVTTTAHVISEYQSLRGPGSVGVSFDVAGRRWEANLQLSCFGDRLAVGSQVRVDYDPEDPSRARLAGHHDLAQFLVAAVPLWLFVGWVWNDEAGDIAPTPSRRHRGRERGHHA